jgi:hypothetical protein
MTLEEQAASIEHALRQLVRVDRQQWTTPEDKDALVRTLKSQVIAAEFGGELPPKRWARIEPPWLPGEGAIPIPTKHMEIGMHWQKVNKDRDNFDFEEFVEKHAVPPIAVAVSKTQVYWARGELKKVEAGGYSSRSYEELKALASTPLDGLPERASKKPPKRTKAN